MVATSYLTGGTSALLGAGKAGVSIASQTGGLALAASSKGAIMKNEFLAKGMSEGEASAISLGMAASTALIEKVMQCLTAEESISAIREYGYNEVFDILAQKAAQKSHAHTHNEILVETMMFDLKGNLICESNGANTLLEELIR